MPNHLAPEHFRPLMEKLVVDQHNRSYCHSMSISIRWQDDDTHARDDVANFQSVLRMLGFNPAREYVIPVASKTPGWDLRKELITMFDMVMSSVEGRAIVFIHYAGHGTERSNAFHLTDVASTKAINVNNHIINLVDESSDVPQNIDVVLLFDACYSPVATRNYTSATQIVEILLPVDDSSIVAFSAGETASLTGKLANEIIARKNQGARYVELSELIAFLREQSPVKKPSHRVLVGTNSLRFTIPENETATGYQPPGPATRTVFSLRLVKGLTKEQLGLFVEWVRTLPQEVGLKLDGVYETKSMVLVFCAPWTFWSKMKGYRFVSFISETLTPNLLFLSEGD
ncbi:hypothetical protein BDV25DRAFT_135946 [Aspergillus avenaceus]|uniref:Peptidase C14 caspase domain-containing protein n=1 Tax=Aspergillus avenaceus TaxID=36643 RepID=A0A5N6U7D2_ASPAV|nr:hypothetical protein BDV25DRAFT_135946 [Aspergillus avenaceus]